MTQLFRAGMIGAARSQRAARLGEGAAVISRTLAGDTSPLAPRRAAPSSLFDGMMSDFQDAFDSFQYFNPFTVAQAVPAAAPRGSFTEMRFAGPTGSRSYKLYVPACAEAGVALPLVVMLHGCTQSPDDFAAGTRHERVGRARRLPGLLPGADLLGQRPTVLELVQGRRSEARQR